MVGLLEHILSDTAFEGNPTATGGANLATTLLERVPASTI